MGLVRHAPIGRRAKQPRRTKWIGAQIVLRVGIKRAIYRRLEIKRIVDKRVGSHTGYMRRKGAVEDCAGSESVTQGRSRVREGPGRRRIPGILDGWVVVGGNAVRNIDGAEPRRVRITDIGIVPGPGMRGEWIGAKSSGPRRVVSHLLESTDMIRDGATPKEAYR